MTASSVKPTIDLDSDGKHVGFLQVPHSVHRSGYGWIPVPIVSIRNGAGPRVLLVGGNHGDEYEGQVVLMDLIRSVSAADIAGQIIVLPAANFPAVMNGTRVSPIDDGNLNRVFPGRFDGTPTEMIADFITQVLAPRTDYSFDLHSGGSSLDYIPTLITGRPEDAQIRRRTAEMIAAIGLPYAMVFRGGTASGNRTLAAVIRAQGGMPFAAELGGAGTLRQTNLAIARAALTNFLAATGSVKTAPPSGGAPTKIVAVGPADYLYAPDNGIFEPAVMLGDTVTAGQAAGRIHFPDTPWKDPVDVAFHNAGTIICIRPMSLVVRGDCLFHTCRPWPDAFQ